MDVMDVSMMVVSTMDISTMDVSEEVHGGGEVPDLGHQDMDGLAGSDGIIGGQDINILDHVLIMPQINAWVPQIINRALISPIMIVPMVLLMESQIKSFTPKKFFSKELGRKNGENFQKNFLFLRIHLKERKKMWSYFWLTFFLKRSWK